MTEPSGFDPSVFLGATLTEANKRRPPIPANTVLRGVLQVPKFRETEGKKEDNLGVKYIWCDIPVELDLSQNPGALAVVFPNQTEGKVILTHSFRLDVLPEGKGLDMSIGKNSGLRVLRDALNMNQDGQPFNLQMVQGRTILVTIKHDLYLGDVLDKIGAIAKVS